MANRQEIERAVVIGSGQMGPGIAYTLASTDCFVTMYGRTTDSVNRGVRSFHKAVELLAEAACISAEQAAAIARKIDGSTELESAVKRADLVVESIAENSALKQELFKRVESSCSVDTILASNTSGLPATELAGALRYPGRFAVMHFWNPPHLLPLVEIVKGEKTSRQTIDLLVQLMKDAGKKPVVVLKDTPGQLGNRLFHALIREAIWIVQEGIASVEDVDTAVKYGLGRRFPVYGPLEHQDVVGLDTVYAIQNYLCRALCNETKPAALLEEKAISGQLGTKSGLGFYDWTKRDIGPVLEKRDAFLVELLKAEKLSALLTK